MNLWIRTQDKQQLITEIKNIYISSDCGLGYEILCSTPYYSDIKLGLYKSFVRAKEVLDKIQTTLKGKGVLKYNNLLKQVDRKKVEEMYDNNFYCIDGRMEMVQPIEYTEVYEMPET